MKNLLVKQAIQEVEPQKGQFVSRLFTVPKKDGSRRPVVNLRPLNNFIMKRRFKMEGVVLLKSLVQQGDWMASIDLKDAYLSVVVAEEHRRYLRFQWERQLYEFLCLPFGLSSAPRTFTKLLKPVMSLIRQQGVRSIVFLDDMLLMAGSRERLLRQVQEIVQLLQLLGFVVNFEKSQLNPTQRIQYLGFEIDSVRMRISLPKEKVARIRQECQWALQQKSISIRDLTRLIGRLTATMQAVLPAPLHYRNLQRIKNQALRQFQDFSTVVILDRNAREELTWWQNSLENWNGKAMLEPTPDMIAETDASLLGWGAVSEGVRTGGLWSEGERMHHINLLELTAGAFAVKTFARHRRNIHMTSKWTTRQPYFTSTRWVELDHISLPIQLASCGSGASSGGLHCQQNICLGPATS